MRHRALRVALVLALAAVTVAACSGGSSPGPGGSTGPTFTPANASSTVRPVSPSAAGTPGAIVATETEYRISLSNEDVRSGHNAFRVMNGGARTHSLYVIQTSTPAEQLPLKGNVVDLSASGLTVVARIEQVPAGQTASLEADLPTGEYVLICNIPGHYQQGMHVTLNVN